MTQAVAAQAVDPVRQMLRDAEAYLASSDEIERAAAATTLLRSTEKATVVLRKQRQNTVRTLREAGLTFQQIADTLGVSKGRAVQILRGVTGGDYWMERPDE